jgi:hypothetical protein
MSTKANGGYDSNVNAFTIIMDMSFIALCFTTCSNNFEYYTTSIGLGLPDIATVLSWWHGVTTLIVNEYGRFDVCALLRIVIYRFEVFICGHWKDWILLMRYVIISEHLVIVDNVNEHQY